MIFSVGDKVEIKIKFESSSWEFRSIGTITAIYCYRKPTFDVRYTRNGIETTGEFNEDCLTKITQSLDYFSENEK